jgi:hypothetical protein
MLADSKTPVRERELPYGPTTIPCTEPGIDSVRARGLLAVNGGTYIATVPAPATYRLPLASTAQSDTSLTFGFMISVGVDDAESGRA